MKIERRCGYPKKEWFENIETGEEYRRIVGGLAWPGHKPGFSVILGEELEENKKLKLRHLRVLAEAEDFVVEALLRKSCELAKEYSVDRFLGDIQNEGMMILYRQFRGGEGLKPIILSNAPLPMNFNYYVQTIKGHLSGEKKSLWFGPDSKLADFLSQLPPDQVLSSSIDDYPAITALGFAVAFLDRRPYIPSFVLPSGDRKKKIAASFAVKPLKEK